MYCLQTWNFIERCVYVIEIPKSCTPPVSHGKYKYLPNTLSDCQPSWYNNLTPSTIFCWYFSSQHQLDDEVEVAGALYHSPSSWEVPLLLGYLILSQKQWPLSFHGHWIGKTHRLLGGKPAKKVGFCELPRYPKLPSLTLQSILAGARHRHDRPKTERCVGNLILH